MATSTNHDPQTQSSGRPIGATSEARSRKFRDASIESDDIGVDVAGDVSSKLSSLADLARNAGEKLLDVTRERPALALSVAAGAGFVLAGGLSTKAGRVALMSIVEYAVFRASGGTKAQA